MVADTILTGCRIFCRFASTHRVCRTEGHTFDSIQARCKSALNGGGVSGKQLRAEQTALNEVEFEWIRQVIWPRIFDDGINDFHASDS